MPQSYPTWGARQLKYLYTNLGAPSHHLVWGGRGEVNSLPFFGLLCMETAWRSAVLGKRSQAVVQILTAGTRPEDMERSTGCYGSSDNTCYIRRNSNGLLSYGMSGYWAKVWAKLWPWFWLSYSVALICQSACHWLTCTFLLPEW